MNYSDKLINESWLEQALIDLGPLQRRDVLRDGEVIRTLYYRVAAGFRPEQLRTPERRPD